MSSFISRFGGDMAARASGKAAIERALNSGMTINEVRNLASREGVNFGPAAQQFLNSRSANSFVSKYGGNYNTMRNSGMQSVNRAMASGMSWEQVQQAAQREGISWGEKAQSYFSSQTAERDRKAEEQRLKAEEQAELDRLNSFQQVNDSINSPDSIYQTPEATAKSWIKRDYGNDNTPDYAGLTMKTPANAKGGNASQSAEPGQSGDPYSGNFLQGKIDKFKEGFRGKTDQFGLDLRGGNRVSRGEGGRDKEDPWLQVRKMRESRRRGYGGNQTNGGDSFDRRDS